MVPVCFLLSSIKVQFWLPTLTLRGCPDLSNESASINLTQPFEVNWGLIGSVCVSVSSVCPCGQIMHGEARRARKWWANDGCRCSAASLRDRLLSRALITAGGSRGGSNTSRKLENQQRLLLRTLVPKTEPHNF